MSDWESMYFDTISMADSEATQRRSLSQSRNTIYQSAVDLDNGETVDGIAATPALSRRLLDVHESAHKNAGDVNYRHSTAFEQQCSADGIELSDIYDANGHSQQQQVLAMPMMMRMLMKKKKLKAKKQPIGNVRSGSYAAVNTERSSDVELELENEPAVLSTQHLVNNNNNNNNNINNNNYTNSSKSPTPLASPPPIPSPSSPPFLSQDRKLPITYAQWKFRTRRRFRDGLRIVDFVLAYNGDDHELEHLRKREVFAANLEREGLELERDNTQRVHFIKLRAPIEVLCRYAEILKIKLPLKPLPGQEQIDETDNHPRSRFARRIARPRIHNDFQRNYSQLYDWNHPNFFDASTRNLIINFILARQQFVQGEETPNNHGIDKLLEDGVYLAAYTLHDDNDRNNLLQKWASVEFWGRFQSLDNIKNYFGPKVALYFAWLNFYMIMLIPISIFGIVCFAYGYATPDMDVISRAICNDNGMTIMCPQCDGNCDYWPLSYMCQWSQFNYMIDNGTTVWFAFVLSVWAVFFLKFWKRYSAGLVHSWGLTEFSQKGEEPRSQYLAKLRDSEITQTQTSFWSFKFKVNLASYSIVMLTIYISLISILAMIIYYMAQKASHIILGDESSISLMLPITAGILDLLVISLLDCVYSRLAVTLTNYECYRTQTEHNDSLAIKNYVFQFFNYYSSLFYIAVLKGKFVGKPTNYNRILSLRQEECNPGGCLLELSVQLVIIMVGKHAVNAFVNMLVPYALRSLREFGARRGWRMRNNSEEHIVSCNQWTEDYHLLPAVNNSLYPEYLEMVLQYGFITLFGLAFPLAPLLALIYNIFKVRLDAIKMLTRYRRPIAERARHIGVWQNIITIVTKIAITTSAIIIAFSTNLIPKLIYQINNEHDGTLAGYVNFTLSSCRTEELQVKPVSVSREYQNIAECHYTDFSSPMADSNSHDTPIIYWKITVARLAFVILYQNFFGLFQAVLAWVVPDVSKKLRMRIKLEAFLLREHTIQHERRQVTGGNIQPPTVDAIAADEIAP